MTGSSLSEASDDTVTTIPFTQVDLSQRETWDDTELVKAYDRAIASYRMVNGLMGEGTEGEEWQGKEEQLVNSIGIRSDLEAAAQAQLVRCPAVAQRAAAAALARIEVNVKADAEMQAEAFVEAEADAEALVGARTEAVANSKHLLSSCFAHKEAALETLAGQAPELAMVLSGVPKSAISISEAAAAETERLLAWERYYQSCGWMKDSTGWKPSAPNGLKQQTAARWSNVDAHWEKTSTNATPGPVASASMSTNDTKPTAHDVDLTNLILAWYHCGFFTAKYQEQHAGGRS